MCSTSSDIGLKKTPARRPSGGESWADGGSEAAVSDVVGSVLLVGITVMTAAGFALLVFSFDGPSNTLHADVELRVDPGLGSWGTGDESIQLVHLGGESISASATTVVYEVAGTTRQHTGSGLGSTFSDGALTIGETWESPDINIPLQTTVVNVDVVTTAGGGSSLFASGAVTGRGTVSTGGSACSGDVTPPTVAWTQDPADLDALTVDTTVTLTAVLSDGCAGVDTSADPVLMYGFSTPPASSLTMTHGSGNTWTATLPAETWSTRAGQTLYYQATGMRDRNNNVGSSPIEADLITLSYTYFSSSTDLVGTVTTPDNAKNDDSATTAGFAEAGSSSSTLLGSSAAGTSTNPARALTSNAQYAVHDASGEYTEVTGFTAPTGALGVRSVVIGFEARDSGTGTDPTVSLDYKIGTGSYLTGTPTPTTFATSDGTYTRDVTNLRAWTVSDIGQLTVRVLLSADNGPNLELNTVFVTVQYEVSGGSEQALHALLDWSGLPASGVNTLQIRYQTSGDTFVVQVWDSVAQTFRTRGTTLDSVGTFNTFTYAIVADEYNGGAPRIRFLDATPAGTTQGTLTIDYARMANG